MATWNQSKGVTVDRTTNFKIDEMLEKSLTQFDERFPIPAVTKYRTCVAALGDIFVRRVVRLGHRDKFPRPYDWENLISQLRPNEEILWIIHKPKNGYAIEVSFGLRFVDEGVLNRLEWENRRRRFEMLCRQFAKSAFPESVLERKDGEKDDYRPNNEYEFLNSLKTQTARCLVAGFPSLKDAKTDSAVDQRREKERPFAGLNDIVEMHNLPENDFTLMFVVSRAPQEMINNDFEALFTIQNEIKPLIEKVQQITDGENESTSRSTTVTNGTSQTDSTAGGEDVAFKEDPFGVPTWKKIKRLGRSIKRYFVGTGGKIVYEENLSAKRQRNTSSTTNHSVAEGESYTRGTSHQVSRSIKEFASDLAFSDSQIKDLLKHLTQALGTGGYYSHALVYSTEQYIALSVANAVQATLSGSQSNLRPMQVYALNSVGEYDWLKYSKSLALGLREHGFVPCILNCAKSSLFLPLPTHHLVGLPLKQSIFYGKEDCPDGDLCVGKMSCVLPPVRSEIKVVSKTTSQVQENELSAKMRQEDVFSHMFIVGTTGSGKTTRAAEIIANTKARRVIIETAKKTYWNELCASSVISPSDLLVYTLGDSTHNPLRINPFFFEEGTSLKQHISILADAIADLLPMEALIGPKIRAAIERSYQLCGWDIETSTRDKDTDIAIPLYPNMVLFNLVVHDIAEELSEYGAEVRGNYRGALKNRAAIFLDSVYQDIFAFDGEKTIDELFPVGKTVIIEMEEMPQSEINMPAFVISILLQRLRAYCSSNDGDKDGKFLVAIEEAHNVLSKKFGAKKSDTESGKGGHLVNQVTRLLAEGRGLGMGMLIIDQSAANIAPSVITNTNTKFVFRQEDGTEVETIGKAIGLPKEEWPNLQLLERGEFIIKNQHFVRPVKIAPFDEREAEERDSRKKVVQRADIFKSRPPSPNYQKAFNCLEAYRRTEEDGYNEIEGSSRLDDGEKSDLMAYLNNLANQNSELVCFYRSAFMLKQSLCGETEERDAWLSCAWKEFGFERSK